MSAPAEVSELARDLVSGVTGPARGRCQPVIGPLQVVTGDRETLRGIDPLTVL